MINVYSFDKITPKKVILVQNQNTSVVEWGRTKSLFSSDLVLIKNIYFVSKCNDISPKPKDFGCWVGENNVIVLQVIAPWDLEVWLKTYTLLVKVMICKYDGENILVKIKFCPQMKWYVNFEGRTVILDWLYLYELSEYSPLYNESKE